MPLEIVGFDCLKPALTNDSLRAYLTEFDILQPLLTSVKRIEYQGRREHRAHFNPSSFILKSGQAYPGYVSGESIYISDALPAPKIPRFTLSLVGESTYNRLGRESSSRWQALYTDSKLEDANFVTPVAAMTPLDDFMECFATFLTNPKRVIVAHLGKYTFLAEQVFQS